MSIKVCPVCCSDLCRGARGGRCEDLDTSVLGSDGFLAPGERLPKPRKVRHLPPRVGQVMRDGGDYVQ